jgi:DOMON domain
MWKSAIFLFCFVLASEAAPLPSSFEGHWFGVPTYSVLGPFPESGWNFSIVAMPPTVDFGLGESGTNRWLMSDGFGASSWAIPDSQQQFWVESDSKGIEGSLIYCGVIRNFFSTVLSKAVRVPFKLDKQSENEMAWCIRTSPTSSDCHVRWTMTLLQNGTVLHSRLRMPNPVYHFEVYLHRIAADATPFLSESARAIVKQGLPPPCNLTTSNRLPPQLVCPHMQRERAAAAAAAKKSDDYAHCYMPNPVVDYRLEWTMNNDEKTVSVRISIPAGDKRQWVALGLQPDFPLMHGMDIALGYLDESHQGCVRSMYADAPVVGVPVDYSGQKLIDTKAEVAEDRLFVSFTRPFQTGHHNISSLPTILQSEEFTIAWAAGRAPSSCTAPPLYHGIDRGTLIIDWAAPQLTWPNSMKCSEQ